MKRFAIHAGLICAFLFAIALSVSPQWHERFHPDARQSQQHECGVTLIAAGNYHHAAPAPMSILPAAPTRFSHVATLNPVWVASPFLSASIFEHAPPSES